MIIKQLKVINESGIHARPSCMIIKLVEGFKSKITLDGSDARSILSIMTLAATKGRKLELIVDGEDEEKAAEAIEHLFKDGFFEKQSKRRSFNEKKQSRN